MSYFNDDQTTGQEGQTDDNQSEDWMAKVVAEKGDKWSDPQTIAKGYVSSQEYIKQLEQQVNELKEDMTKQDYSQELLEQLRQKQATPTAKEPTSVPNDSTSGDTKGDTNSVVDEEKLKSLITQTLTEREKQNTATQNLQTADARLKELYGTEVGKVMDTKASELGMSKQRLAEIASESPTAFFRLIGEQAKAETNSLPKSSVNTARAEFTRPSGERNNDFYQKLRRENKKLYYSPKTQQQMMNDRLALGAKFFN